VLGATPGWLRYRLPRRAIRRNDRLVCVGQKQVWFLLRLRCDESAVQLDATDHPEFDQWQWVDFWYPVQNVVMFKRRVYASALDHLAPLARNVAGVGAVPPPDGRVDPALFARPQPRRPRQPVPRRDVSKAER